MGLGGNHPAESSFAPAASYPDVPDPMYPEADVAELAAAVQAADDASDGDSNDAEIEALQNALALALRRWPEVSEGQA